jgi:hypothetical protein
MTTATTKLPNVDHATASDRDITRSKGSDQPRYKIKSPTRGGARPGAGRKKGSTPRYTLEDLVSQVEHHVGMTFAERVAINYAEAISRSDHAGVRDYDKILLGKMVADKQEVVTVESEDATVAKAAAFAEALSSLTTAKGKSQ